LDINSAWESVRENTKTSAKENLGYYRLKHDELQFDNECPKLLDQWKQAELQWLQNSSQIIGDNCEI
jgi:S-methylmethionine-dependent homocysteine/selenocysteine methylase